MFILAIYFIAVITWGWVLFDLVRATIHSIKYKTDTPRLLVPLAFASLSLFLESAYFFVGNLYRYIMQDEVTYLAFLSQDNLVIVKIFIAISGVLMLLKMKSEKGKKSNDYYKHKKENLPR